MFWIGFLAGLLVGGTVGVIAMACCVVAGNADRNMEKASGICKTEIKQA